MKAAIWKPVPSYPGMLASSSGQILLPPRYTPLPNGGIRLHETKPTEGVVKRSTANASHVFRATFTRQFGNVKLHRAVCEAFHGPQPFDGAVVIHIDEDGLNNRADNLKWGTQKENLNMPKVKAYHRSRVGDRSAWAVARRAA